MSEPRQKENRWQYAQTKEDEFWKRNGVYNDQSDRVVSRYGPVIAELSRQLKPDSKILDVGCGPTCTGKLFSIGSKTYLDPLMDSYLSTYPEKIPEGEKLCCAAESIPKADKTFDVIISVNALDHMIDPPKVLSEIRRVLKNDGIFLLGLFLHPPSIAFFRRLIENHLPFAREDAHPYSYTRKSIRVLLGNFFHIQKEISVYRKDSALFPKLHREDRMFICGKSNS
jgi:ubiquinone/menaquinone biosynthesis C-methylase UbiE